MKPDHSQRPQWAKWVIVLAVVAAIAGIALSLVATHFEPLVRAHVVKALSLRYNAQVKLRALHVTLFPRLSMAGEGLEMRRNEQPELPPFVKARRFTVRTSLSAILSMPVHIQFMRLEGLELHLPPKKETTGDNVPKTAETSKPASATLVVDDIDADGTFLEMLPRDSSKPSLQFHLTRLALHSAGKDVPMEFRAELTNPKPPGLIESTGHFGPFQSDEPGDSPLDGRYTFSHADLSVFHGIGGTLSSTGEYHGKLDRIEVRGATDTPDFTVSTGGQPIDLRTSFEATVNGTDGDTYLHPVDATFGQTEMICNGMVEHESGSAVPGKTKALDVYSKRARIEDLLRLVVKGAPVMTGAAKLHTSFLLPPGKGEVIERLRLEGTFTVSQAVFTGSAIQEKITDLSLRGQGEPREADRKNVGPDATAPVSVASNFEGKFGLRDGIVTLPRLSFSVPGASINLAGSYGLKSETLNFAGIFHMDAKVSQAFTGWKSLLLKAADPFFSKHGYTEAPIRIEGTRAHPMVGLDLFHKHEP